MSNRVQIKITIDNHQTFYSIAYRHHLQVEQLVAQRHQRTVKDDEDVDFVCEKNAAIQQSAMVVVIFSALTLEAFINHYGIEKFSHKYFDRGGGGGSDLQMSFKTHKGARREID